MYTITFTDQYGNSVTYHAVTREQAEQIASEYASDYPGCSVSITGSEPSPAQSPDVQAIAEENVNEPHYRVIFKNKEGSSAYTAQTLQQAKQIAEQESKFYKGESVLILTPDNEIERVTFRQIREPTDGIQRTAQKTQSTLNRALLKTQQRQQLSVKNSLDLDGALHRAAVDSENAQLVAAYAQKLIDEGKSPQEIEKALQERYGVQANIKTLTFKESPEAAMYRQIEKEERAREAAEEAQNAVDKIMTPTSPSYAILSGLNKIGKGIESKAKQLNEAAMKNSNPVIAYGEAVGAALLGAAAGVAELPEQTAEFVASAVKHPVKAVKSLLLAPVTAVENAVKDVETGDVVDFGKIVGQTFAAGEVADELGITPSRAIEKIPYSEKVLAPAKEFAERATAKLNDVFVKPLTEYKPQRTTVIVDTGEEKPVVTVAKSPEQATLAAIKDVGRVKEIKPVTGLVAETAFNLKAEPVEDGVAKVKGEEVEGKAFTKARLKTGYELQTENPVRSVKVVTEYANRLGRKAVLASELGEDSVKLLLKKGDEIKGYGVKVVDTYPLLDQESFGGLRVFGEARDAIPEETVKTIDLRDEETAKPIETIDLREMDENVRKAVFGEEDRSISRRSTGEQTYELKTSRFKVVDVSEEMKTLESELNDEIELPDISKTFEKAIDFGKDVLDIGMGLGISGLNGMSELERAHARNTISNILYNDVIGKQKGKDEASNKNRPDVSPDVTPATKPSTSVTPSTTPAVTPAVTVIPYSTPEPETNAKSKTKKPEPPVPTLFFPSGGGENLYKILEEESSRFGRAVKVNPVVTNPLTVLFDGGKKKSRRKRR